MKNEARPGVPWEVYRQLDAVNWSTLKHLQKSPAHYRAALENPRPPSPAMAGGTAFHLATLEPERYDEEIAIWEGKVRRGKAWDAFCEENAGRTILKPEESDNARRMAEAVRAHPIAGALLSSGQPEVTLTWTDPGSFVGCKGRADWLDAERGGLWDLKRARSTDPREFSRQAGNLGYHLQLAFYSLGYRAIFGVKPNAVGFIACEPEPPFDVAVFKIDPDDLDLAEERVLRLLDRFDACQARSDWPGRSPRMLTLDLPPWTLYDPVRKEAP